jgi:hypothetical protein
MAIAGMILVNNPGSWSHVYPPLRHAPWHGWTPTDLIFPFFLFIVGVAVPFSFSKRLERGSSRGELFGHVIRRSAILFGLVFVVGAVVMGVGGALYAHYMASIDYSHFDPLYATFLIWVMLMLGGSGNNRGAILGAFVVWGIWSGTASLVDALRPALEVISSDLPSRAPYLRFLFISVLLLAILHLRPQGMIGEQRRVE